MKRIIPALLAVLLVFSFAGCGDKEEPTTTSNTQPAATTENVSDTTESTTEALTGGYVLTTKPGQTVPTVPTTAFVIGESNENALPGENLTIPSITAPVVITDFVPSNPNPVTTPTTKETAPQGNTEPSTTKVTGPNEEDWNDQEPSSTLVPGETEYHGDNTADNKPLNVVGTANDERGNIIVMFDYADWDRIKSQKCTAKVNCNGRTKNSLKGTVNGVNDGGQFEFIADINDLKPVSGDYITITFAKGAIESIGGGQKSAPCTVSLYYS